MRGVRKQAARVRRAGGRPGEHLPAQLRPRVPRVLYPRLVHRRQEADLPLLPRKGRSQGNRFAAYISESGLLKSGSG